MFSKILDDYENHKDVINEDDLLWKYKWVWSSTFDIPEIPMEQVEAVGEDYKTRILAGTDILCGVNYQRWCGGGIMDDGSMTRQRNILIRCWRRKWTTSRVRLVN